MTHEDWFDSDGFFIGHIPRVIWRPIIWPMKYQNDYSDLEHVQQCIIDTGFYVDIDKAIAHIMATTSTSWSLEELESCGFVQLTQEIFIKVCSAISDGDTFQLINNESIK